MTEKLSEGSMREHIATLAGPRQWSDTRESWLARAARKAGLSYRTIKALWYGEITDENNASARLLRQAAELANQYESMARIMNENNSEFYREHALALLDMARTLRGEDRSDAPREEE